MENILIKSYLDYHINYRVLYTICTLLLLLNSRIEERRGVRESRGQMLSLLI